MAETKRARGTGSVRKRPNGGWAIRYYRDGEEIHESVARTLGRPPSAVTRADAERVLRKRLAEIEHGAYIGPKHERLTVLEVCEDYLRDVGLRRGQETLWWWRCRLALIQSLHPVRASSLTTGEVQEWMQETLDDGYAAQTVNHGVALLSASFRFAERTGRLARTIYLPRLKLNNARQGFFERHEFEAVAAQLSPVLADLAWFAYFSGCRKGELLALRWEHVDRARGVVTLHDTKNGDARIVPLEGELAEVIARRWKARVLGSATVFARNDGGEREEIWDQWRNACRRAGFWEWIDERAGLWQATKMFHDLRRTFARDALNAGVPESVIMKQGGWRSASVFRRYAIVAQGDLRRAQHTLAAHRHGQFTGSEAVAVASGRVESLREGR